MVIVAQAAHVFDEGTYISQDARSFPLMSSPPKIKTVPLFRSTAECVSLAVSRFPHEAQTLVEGV